MNTLTEEKLKELEEMASLLQTQDNRCTADPLFCVMQKEKIVGMDPNYDGDYLWIDQDSGEYVEASEEEVIQLESLLESGSETKIDGCTYEQIYYVERDRFITAAFTEEDAKEHLRLNGHNIPGAHIYVTSLYRTPGMILLRNSLPALISSAREALRLREALESSQEALGDAWNEGYYAHAGNESSEKRHNLRVVEWVKKRDAILGKPGGSSSALPEVDRVHSDVPPHCAWCHGRGGWEGGYTGETWHECPECNGIDPTLNDMRKELDDHSCNSTGWEK